MELVEADMRLQSVLVMMMGFALAGGSYFFAQNLTTPGTAIASEPAPDANIVEVQVALQTLQSLTSVELAPASVIDSSTQA